MWWPSRARDMGKIPFPCLCHAGSLALRSGLTLDLLFQEFQRTRGSRIQRNSSFPSHTASSLRGKAREEHIELKLPGDFQKPDSMSRVGSQPSYWERFLRPCQHAKGLLKRRESFCYFIGLVFVCFRFCCCFETLSRYVALDVLKPTMWLRLALNSHLPLPPKGWD